MKTLFLTSLAALALLPAPALASDEARPSSRMDVRETDIGVNTGRPLPQARGSAFSRDPYPAFINQKNGQLVIEYTLPRFAQDGPSMFVIESCSLSPDGTELTVHRQMLYAPSDGRAKSLHFYKVKTTRPYHFSVRGRLYIFEVRNSIISSCKVFKGKKGQEKPTFLRQIYPASEWVYGIFSPV